ncbi:MAG: HPF/RaiA family ribosome-associated protein [Mycoplasma sp.]
MLFNVRYIDMDKPIGVEDFIEKKLKKLDKFDWIGEEVKVELVRFDKENSFKTFLQITPKVGNKIVAEARSDNLNTSIDLAISKLNSQIVKFKESHLNH